MHPPDSAQVKSSTETLPSTFIIRVRPFEVLGRRFSAARVTGRWQFPTAARANSDMA